MKYHHSSPSKPLFSTFITLYITRHDSDYRAMHMELILLKSALDKFSVLYHSCFAHAMVQRCLQELKGFVRRILLFTIYKLMLQTRAETNIDIREYSII